MTTLNRLKPDKGLSCLANVKDQQELTSDIAILIVEDSEAIRLLISAVLSNYGYRVETADCGESALQYLQKGMYQLILMDIQMPGINGFEAADRIKGMSAPVCDIPIIAMSANVTSSEQEKACSYGMNGYIAKPFKLDYLIENIEHVLLPTQSD